MSRISIVEDIVKKVKKFNLTRHVTSFKILPPPDEADPVEWVRKAVDEAVLQVTAGLDPKDKVGFSFEGSNLEYPVWMSFRDAATVTTEDLWDLMTTVFQSNSTGLRTDTFRLTATSVRMPRGTGRIRRYNTFDQECHKRRGIISIKANDNLCLLRALVVGKAYALNSSMKSKIRMNKGKLQDKEAMKLLNDSGVVIPPEGAGIEQIRELQTFLSSFQIVVYEYGEKGKNVIFEGPTAEHRINLLFYKNHYAVISSLTAAFACKYYCESCHLPYENKESHRCGKTCPCCQESPPCEKKKAEIKCSACNRSFRGESCYKKHIDNRLCDKISRCTNCLKTIKKNRVHTCGEYYCKVCSKHQPTNHYCFMQPDKREPTLNRNLFIFFDFESRQEEALANEDKIHIPNLCICQQRCYKCIEDSVENCQTCGIRENVFMGNNCVESFMNYVLQIRMKFRRVTVISHNGRAYDTQFLLRYIFDKTDLNPELITRGRLIIMMKIENIKILDSLNYFPMKLANLPEAFELDGEVIKGYFPHLFNTKHNENYIGTLPDVRFYDPDSMHDEDRVKFLEWYNLHRNDTFEMQKEIVKYCRNDVDILTKACLKFHELFTKELNVIPFIESYTVASACNLVFRRKFLQPDTIGLIPPKGYRCVSKQSALATMWLIYEEVQRSINIRYAAKQKEVVVGGVKVDGFCEETKQVFEFHGCYFHGHQCFLLKRDDPISGDPMDTLNQRYERTLLKSERLRSLGYEIIEKWECDFRREMRDKKGLVKELENHPVMCGTPLNPRDAFYGGRTGCTKSYYKIKPGEKIKYDDICSLYPYICKYGKFPIGHPQVIVGAECNHVDLKKTNGLIKCNVLPPRKLYHPILPTKMNNKLLFALCRTCAMESNQELCQHSDQERTLKGTFVLDEVNKAIEKGYRVMEIFEIWKYDVVQYDPTTRTGGLFTEMMNRFILMKQQASGWPTNCTTDEQKHAYIEEFFEKEGIRMEFSEIVSNPGLRSLAKLMLNSFWGKFGQRNNLPKTNIVRTSKELFNFLTEPGILIDTLEEINDTIMIVNWHREEEITEMLGTLNPAIAAYTTAQARLKLYNYLEKLGDRVLMYDTDSVIYVSKEGEWDVPTGSCLGEMTNELEKYGSGSYIVCFVSAGPKNYAYLVFSPEYNTYFTNCTIKGFNINFETSKNLNFNIMMNMANAEWDVEPLHIAVKKIRITPQHQVVTTAIKKKYRPCLTKRVFLRNYNSLPYGYRRREKNQKK